MKKILSTILASSMILSMSTTIFAKSLENFEKLNEYEQNTFSDITLTDWFYQDVINAYELGIMLGKSETNFAPKDKLTIAETLTLACRIHNIYNGGDGILGYNSNSWYDPYVQYAISNNFIENKQFSNYNAYISRIDFVNILSKAFPSSEFAEINQIYFNAIPDVEETKENSSVYTFYRAGILTGSDIDGNFNPESNILREAVVAIISRMTDHNLRKSFTLGSEEIIEEADFYINSSKTDFTGSVSDVFELDYEVYPSDFYINDVIWYSNNINVAIVDEYGKVTIVGTGNAIITLEIDGICKHYYFSVPEVENLLKKDANFSYDKNYAPAYLNYYSNSGDLRGSVSVSLFEFIDVSLSEEYGYKVTYKYSATCDYSNAYFYLNYIDANGINFSELRVSANNSNGEIIEGFTYISEENYEKIKTFSFTSASGHSNNQ